MNESFCKNNCIVNGYKKNYFYGNYECEKYVECKLICKNCKFYDEKTQFCFIFKTKLDKYNWCNEIILKN